jgi:hypothetical protein
MLTLEYAKNPVYASPEGDCIVLTVKWEEFAEEHMFSATSYDSMLHGRDLYNKAKNGDFGVVGAYVPDPSMPTNTPISSGTQTL